MTSNTMTNAQMQSWTEAFADKSGNSFANAFADNVTLELSVFVRPIKGRDCVKSVMTAANNAYDALTFTRQVENPQQTYLECDGEAFSGQPLCGVTILIKNPQGLIEHLGALTVTSYQFYRWGKHHTNWTENVGGSFKSPTSRQASLRLVLFTDLNPQNLAKAHAQLETGRAISKLVLSRFAQSNT